MIYYQHEVMFFFAILFLGIFTVLIYIFTAQLKTVDYLYRNDPKFSDRQVWADVVDEEGLYCFPFRPHLLDVLVKPPYSNFRVITASFRTDRSGQTVQTQRNF